MKWWVVAVGAAGTVLLFAWLGRLAGVSPDALWTIGAAFAALTWMTVLVTVPWNLYFGARRVVLDQETSHRRGIGTRPEQKAEAQRIARGMLRFAIGGHLGTAAVVATVSGATVGYYLAGFFLLSTAVRPAGAYFTHLRYRIGALSLESTHPRDDVLALLSRVTALESDLAALREQTDQRLAGVDDDLRRAAADTAHLRANLAGDRRTIDQMVRRVDATIDGVSDHRELLTGLRALVRMIRSE